jgi:hypothetical protein
MAAKEKEEAPVPAKKAEKKIVDPKAQVKLVLSKKGKNGQDLPMIEGEDYAVVVFEHGKRMTIAPGEFVRMAREAAESQVRSAKLWDKGNLCKGCLSIEELA